MSSTYSPDLRIELIGTGDQAGVWGATTNNNLAYVLEQAVAGYVSVAVGSANQALTYINGATSVAADNQSVHASLALTTSTGANFAVYAPPASKQYTIYNASAYTATIYNSTVLGNTTAAGTGVAIPAGKTMTVWSDGTNFTQQNTHLNSPSFTTPALGTPASGTLTNCTGLPIDTGVSGLGSGVATFLATPSSANLAAAVTGETGSGSLVFSNSPTLVSPALGTPSALVGTNITGTASGLSIGGNAATATSATYATSAGSAGSATNAGYASSAGSATNATYATSAGSATNAGAATNAGYANSAGSATNAGYANSSGYASSAGYSSSTGSFTPSAGAVGSYTIAESSDTRVAGTTYAIGTSVSGSSLSRYDSAYPNYSGTMGGLYEFDTQWQASSRPLVSGGGVSCGYTGTWRLMTHITLGAGSGWSNTGVTALFMRIS